jgi:hypothetical protein
MVFGRSFEKALGAFFRREDPGAALFTEWGAYRDAELEYKKGETWNRLKELPGAMHSKVLWIWTPFASSLANLTIRWLTSVVQKFSSRSFQRQSVN